MGQIPDATGEGVPALPPDDENEALIDALKTFRWTIITFAGFAISSIIIIMLTRMS